MPVYCLAYFLTLKIKTIYSSETSTDFQRTTRRNIAERTFLILKGLRNNKRQTLKQISVVLYTKKEICGRSDERNIAVDAFKKQDTRNCW
jgi:hypothetical protein